MWRRPLEWNLNGTTEPRDGSVDQLSLNSLKDRHGPIRAPKSQIAGLMGKFAKRAEKRLIDETLVPLVEFLPLNAEKHGANLQIFSTTDGHPYFKGLRDKLEDSHGIYLFHDSRDRAIYAGKAQKQTLWAEINLAFNRDRGEVQSLKRVRHPTNRVQYKGPDEMKRRIAKEV